MTNLPQRSKQHIWHPFSQMKLEDNLKGIVRGEGAYLYDEDGNQIIDAISSWWTCIHGHSHPYIAQKIYEQAQTLEHVIFAGFTHKPAVTLVERLMKLLPNQQQKAFFSDNGSTAVEVALKMAFQYWHNKGAKKTKVIALKNSYHGDTFGAMSVGSRDAFTEPFFPFLFDVAFIESPAVNEKLSLQQFTDLVKNKDVAAFIYEPLVQGAGGMLMYSAETLNQFLKIAKEHQVLCIADEVMTGFYRTGKMFASAYLDEQPDIMCLSKGLTGGVLPMSLTTCTQAIYDAFLSDSFMEKTFFHGHSFTANPLACAAANASLDLLEMEECKQNIQNIMQWHTEFALELNQNPKVKNVRQQGTILAFDLATETKTSYANPLRQQIIDYFIKENILIRPLGNTMYLLPPYCLSGEDYKEIKQIIIEFLTTSFS